MPIIPVSVHGTQDPITAEEMAHALGRNNGAENAIAFMENQRGEVRTDDIAGALATPGGKVGQGYPAVMQETANTLAGNSGRCQIEQTHIPAEEKAAQVRRLTPVECERLQGFPDNFTQIPWRGKDPEDCPDGPRYKALGNSMAVPVMRWIGERIEQVDTIMAELKGIEILVEMNS